MRLHLPHLSHRTHLVLGLVLIIVTNLVILLGVAWNRTGEPDSILTLSQRELQLRTRDTTDNSGMTFVLQWRTPPSPRDEPNHWGAFGSGHMPAWLDEEKMQDLGFPPRSEAQREARRHRPVHQDSRDVLLVLEFDGEHYRKALDDTRILAERAVAAHAAAPDDEELERRAKLAENRLLQETRNTSRLFVVDAGLDHAALRARYPDRQRYAIVHGQIMPWYAATHLDDRRGYIKRITHTQINVPHEARSRLWVLPGRIRQIHYEAELAFGRRLEPWIAGVSIHGN